ncbi:MAG: aminomethyl-transferring glycine dehydrogenase subunit GcvPB [Candidatus Hydrogenedentes bacterium]|nr:aminomethyl-transferring glycine dehydrogenase subunit GcvPB [Candidatus Hydrogenedentota bacterium]
MELIYEKCRGRKAFDFGLLDVPEASFPEMLKRKLPPELPEVSELDVVRHFTHLSRRNIGIDTNFYPLGSCTMKYNPKIADLVSNYPGFTSSHPNLYYIESLIANLSGAMQIVYELENMLSEISGMKEVSLQPMAGAHGELAGVLMVSAYHKHHGNFHKRIVLIPDSAHGTNPASAAIAGFEVREISSNSRGTLDISEFKREMTEEVACVMLTCPNTHGLFEDSILEIADIAHSKGALLYYDGANLNAILGQCRPGDLGFDVMHFNLHKTFGTPHGMGGPGAGPVGVGEKLIKFLPGPRVVMKEDGSFSLVYPEHSIGKIAPFLGHFLVAVRAYVYILMQGGEGLKSISRYAVLNANYVLARLKEFFPPAYDRLCMHECVLSTEKYLEHNVKALDFSKAILDKGFHAPTVYFPLTVKEALMIEPTETETKETLDQFCDAMIELANLAVHSPQTLKEAPKTTPVGRLDEVKAAKELNVCKQATNRDV